MVQAVECSICRLYLIFTVLLSTLFSAQCSPGQKQEYGDTVDTPHEGIWIGRDYWAVPMKDWRNQNAGVSYRHCRNLQIILSGESGILRCYHAGR